MALRLVVVKMKVYPNGYPADLGQYSGTGNEYVSFNKPANHLARFATYVADASIASIASVIEGEIESVAQSNI